MYAVGALCHQVDVVLAGNRVVECFRDGGPLSCLFHVAARNGAQQLPVVGMVGIYHKLGRGAYQLHAHYDVRGRLVRETDAPIAQVLQVLHRSGHARAVVIGLCVYGRALQVAELLGLHAFVGVAAVQHAQVGIEGCAYGCEGTHAVGVEASAVGVVEVLCRFVQPGRHADALRVTVVPCVVGIPGQPRVVLGVVQVGSIAAHVAHEYALEARQVARNGLAHLHDVVVVGQVVGRPLHDGIGIVAVLRLAIVVPQHDGGTQASALVVGRRPCVRHLSLLHVV